LDGVLAVDQPTPFPWEALTPSSRAAFEWAAAGVGLGNAVGSAALLFGIVKSHEGTSEPEQLLAHFGRSRDALVAELTAAGPAETSPDYEVKRPAGLQDFPPLGEGMPEVLEAALDVWAPTVSEPLPLSASAAPSAKPRSTPKPRRAASSTGARRRGQPAKDEQPSQQA
jgi:hypothetical protein